LYIPLGEYPTVKNLNNDFLGWCKSPTFRPLILVSKPNVSDPSHWYPFTVSDELKKLLYNKLSDTIHHVIRCPDTFNVNPKPYVFTLHDIVIHECYKAQNEDMLVSVGLNKKIYNCDGVMGASWSYHCFFIHNDKIDFIGNGIEFVDAGDYDSCGGPQKLGRGLR
jgi:hypothetical protein